MAVGQELALNPQLFRYMHLVYLQMECDFKAADVLGEPMLMCYRALN